LAFKRPPLKFSINKPYARPSPLRFKIGPVPLQNSPSLARVEKFQGVEINDHCVLAAARLEKGKKCPLALASERRAA